MAHLPPLVTDLALILIFAGVITLIFKWLKQPLVLGYIVAGVLAGPYIDFFPTVSDHENISTWAEIGVVFLMFALGLEFSFKKLMNVGSTALITAVTEVLSMLAIGYGVGYLMGWETMDSIFLGCMLSMSSTTIIIKAFDDLNLRNRKFTGIVFGTLVVEDLLAILMLVLLPTLGAAHHFAGEAMLGSTLKVVFFLALWFIIGIYFIPIFLKKLKKLMNDETLLVISLGLCLGMVVLANYTGFSAALGAFVMGSILAETIEAEHIEHLVKPLKDLFGAVFFVSVGMMVNPAILVEYALPVFLITMTTLIGKSFFSTFGVLLSGQTLKTSIRSGFSLAQIGEFAFIIAGMGVALGIMSDFIYPVIIAVSVITTFTTPYFIKLADPFAEWLYRILPSGAKVFLERYASGGKTINHESEWKKLLKQFFWRWFIYVILLVAIYLLSTNFIQPFVMEKIEGIWASIICVAATLLLMTPFLTALIINKFHSPELFMNLWNDSKYNRGRMVSLVLLRVVTAGVFMGAVLVRYLPFGQWEVLAVSMIIILLILIFRNDLNSYAKLEKRFINNLNRREEELNVKSVLNESFGNYLSNRDIHLSTFTVPADSPFVGKSLMELSFRRDYGVSIVKILRGERRINIPGKEERIYPQDRLTIVGTDEQMEKFREKLDAYPQTAEIPDREVSLQSFEVDENFVFVGQSIFESGIGQKYKCLIVGLERSGMSLMNPDNSTVFMMGDLVWLVGEEDVVKTMLNGKT